MVQGFELTSLIPIAPLHWTSILHYVILLGALVILVSSQSDVSLAFIFWLAALALVTAGDLYSNLIAIPRFVIFMFRVGIVGIPLILSGIAPSDDTRGLAVVLGVLGFALFAMIFLTCFIPFLGDPRIVGWCR
jgi:hypothetical protein